MIAVGGTSLTLDKSGNYSSESAWSGSGGGLSKYEYEPVPQAQFPIANDIHGTRGVPDVSYNANPGTGYADLRFRRSQRLQRLVPSRRHQRRGAAVGRADRHHQFAARCCPQSKLERHRHLRVRRRQIEPGHKLSRGHHRHQWFLRHNVRCAHRIRLRHRSRHAAIQGVDPSLGRPTVIVRPPSSDSEPPRSLRGGSLFDSRAFPPHCLSNLPSAHSPLFLLAKHPRLRASSRNPPPVVYSFFRRGHSKSHICYRPHRFAAPQVYPK